jgi:hypothetical protein
VPDSWYPRIRVPANSWTGCVTVVEWDRTGLYPEMITSVEEYELRPMYKGMNDILEFEAWWINPNASLMKENKELKQRVDDLSHVQGVLDGLRAYFTSSR